MENHFWEIGNVYEKFLKTAIFKCDPRNFVLNFLLRLKGE